MELRCNTAQRCNTDRRCNTARCGDATQSDRCNTARLTHARTQPTQAHGGSAAKVVVSGRKVMVEGDGQSGVGRPQVMAQSRL